MAAVKVEELQIQYLYLLRLFLMQIKRIKPVFSCFVDLAKAFDSVNLKLLWFKLAHVGLSSKMLRILQSISLNANSLVYSNNSYSKPFPHSKGVCQGCNLSPLLFSLFMNDLEDYLKNHSSGSCQLNSYRLQLMMFAVTLLCWLTQRKVYRNHIQIGGILQ